MVRRTTLVSGRLFVAAVAPAINRSVTGHTGTWGSNTPLDSAEHAHNLIFVMRRSPSQRLLSGLLLLILGALGTGLPSHSHRVAGDDSQQLVASEHHDHGVVLTEQTDRIPAGPTSLAVPAEGTVLADPPVALAPDVVRRELDPPRERAPPSTSPRAPPLPI